MQLAAAPGLRKLACARAAAASSDNMAMSRLLYHGTKADLAVGEGRGRIYVIEPTGPIEDEPNLTDKKFPGNPTKSYRIGRVTRPSSSKP